MSTNRETIRDALVAGLTTALVNTNIVKSVLGYRVREPKALAPLVLVLTAGTEHDQLTYDETGGGCVMRFVLLVFVPAKESGWTDNDAEDRLDLIEYTIRQYVEADGSVTTWERLDYDGPTMAFEYSPQDLGGLAYLCERIPIRAWLLNG